MKRVLITGVGAIAPHGDETSRLFAAIMQGTSALAPVFGDLLPKSAVAADDRLRCLPLVHQAAAARRRPRESARGRGRGPGPRRRGRPRRCRPRACRRLRGVR